MRQSKQNKNARSPKSPRSLNLHEPVKTLVERFEENNPGTSFAWMANKALWEFLQPIATEEDIEAAHEAKLDKPLTLAPTVA